MSYKYILFACAFFSVFPFVFMLTDKENYAKDWSYKFIAQPLAAGARWALILLIFIFDDPIRQSLITPQIAAMTIPIFMAAHYTITFLMRAFKVGGMSFDDESDDEHRRGSTLVDASVVAKSIMKTGEKSLFRLGIVPMPDSILTRSIMLAGSPGTGKSQALQAALDALMRMEARGIVADPSGQFLQRYWREDAAIFNPFDNRSIQWSPFAEMSDEWDATSLSQSMIPNGEGSSKEWNGYAQSFVEAVLMQLFLINDNQPNSLKFALAQRLVVAQQNGAGDSKSAAEWRERAEIIQNVMQLKQNNGELFRLCCIADILELRELLDGTAAQPLVSESNEKMFGSIRGIVGSYIKPYQYLSPTAGRDGFSIKNFVHNGSGWLFIPYRQDQRKALTPLIGAALDIASNALLMTAPDLKRRFLFLLDEFPLLGKVSSIIELLSNGRKHGAVVLLGLQTIAQLRETYSKESAQTILACLGSWLILRCNDSETAKYMAEHAGKQEVLRTNESGGSSDGKKSENWAKQVTVQDTLLASEIQNWPDLTGVLNLAGDFPICNIKLAIVPRVEAKCVDFERLLMRQPIPVEVPDEPVATFSFETQAEPEPAYEAEELEQEQYSEPDAEPMQSNPFAPPPASKTNPFA